MQIGLEIAMMNDNSVIHRSVLVLNQTYEPLHICDVKRAIILLIENKATMVKIMDHQYLHTVSKSFPIPSIIRIQKYIHVRHWEAVLNKVNIFRRDNFTCQYCGAKGVPLTVDHIIPKKLGGKDSWINLVTACIPCNNRKGDQSPADSGMILKKKPIKLHKLHTLQRFIESPIEEWRPYLFLD